MASPGDGATEPDRLGPPIGVVISTIGVDVGWWLESARRLEEAGYRSVWAWDHFVSRGERTTPVLEAWTTLSAAAMTTRRVSVGSFVLNVMNRHPAVVARMATTLQAVSGGRLVLGIGIGGHPAEHEAYGIPFPAARERAEHLREAIAVLRALWAGGPASFQGDHLTLRDAYAHPVVAPPPILVGAGTPAGIRLAAELGDGWAAELDTFEKLEPRYRAALDAVGRRRDEQRVVLSFGGSRKKDAPAIAAHPLVADPRGEIARWRAAGADEVLLTVRRTDDVDALVEAAGRW